MSAKSSKNPSYRQTNDDDGLTLTFHKGQRGLGCFLTIFFVAWSGGCALIVYKLREEPTVEHIMFGVPFLVGWVFVLLVLVDQLFGRETFRLDRDGASLVTRAMLFVRRQFMPLNELVQFGTADRGDETQSHPSTVVLELRTIGRPLRFGGTTTFAERHELTTLLNRRLKELQKARHAPPRIVLTGKRMAFGKRFSGELLGDDVAIGGGKRPVMRTMNDPPIAPPHDSNWRLDEESDAVTFTLRGRWTTGGVIGLLLLNGFWLGIVGTFVRTLWVPGPEQPQGFDWIERFLFLIPFQLIGLVMFLGLLAVVLEPTRRYRWRFARDEIVCSLTWLGIGRRWRYPVEPYDRLEVRLKPYGEVKPFSRLPLGSLWSPKGCPTFDVVLVNPTEREVLTVEGLTLGEACHWADTLIRSRYEWFD